MSQIARVLLWDTCNRNCDGCCNKEWNLDALPKVGLSDLSKYSDIILTGGEPMLNPTKLFMIATQIKGLYPSKRLLLYTAKIDSVMFDAICRVIDGVTVTLHEPKDVLQFETWGINRYTNKAISKRLNVFEDVLLTQSQVNKYQMDGWKLKLGIKWIKNCPLPTNEVFVRWEN